MIHSLKIFNQPVSVLLVAALFTSTVQASDWLEFRGPRGQGLAADRNPALTWSETENVAWKVELPGLGWSSPVVSEGKIYLTTAVAQGENELSLNVLCVSAADGSLLWNEPVFTVDTVSKLQFHQKNSHASPTPVFDGHRLFVHFGTHGTACLKTDGSVIWKTEDLVYQPMHGNGGSPLLAENKLIICCDGSDKRFVVALDSDSGQEVWRREREFDPSRGFSFCTPTEIQQDGRSISICPGSGGVFAYDTNTGEQLWRVNYGEGYSVVPRPVVGHGLVYVCSGFGDGQLLAIDPTGRGDITEIHLKWKVRKGVPKSPSILLVRDMIFMVDDRGIATCVDALSGELHWQERLKGKYSASPVLAGDRIYFQSETGLTTVVKPATSFEELATSQIGDGQTRTFASFAFDGDAILLRSETSLYRIGQ